MAEATTLPRVENAADRSWERLARRILLAVVVVLALWAVVGLAYLVRAAAELRSGQHTAQAVRGQLTSEDLEGGRPVAELRAAQRHFAKGAELLQSRVLAPAWPLPVVGHQVRALRDLSQAAADVAGVGADGASNARAALLESDAAGGDRVALLRRFSVIADTTRARLVGVSVGSQRAVIGPIASRQEKLRTQLTELLDGLSRGGAASAAMADLLQGPHRYLLLGGNNAEMRAGSGMFLTAGVLETANGRVQIRDVQQTAMLYVPDGVPYGGDMEARWGVFHPNREWRNLALTPDFPENAELAVRMWQARTGERLEGAIAIDAVAFADLLKFSGPVAGLAGPVSAENGLQYLLHDQYTIGDPTAPERREALGVIAGQALGALEKGKASVSQATDLSRAVEGRHILVWSSDAAQQDRWQRAGATGELGARDVMLSVLNRGANKLDQYLDVSARADVHPGPATTEVVLHVSLHNRAPTGEPAYIAGPNEDAGVPEGTYKGIVAVNVPGTSVRASIDGASTYAAIGSEGLTAVLAVPVVLPRGASGETVVRFTVPTRDGSLRIVPSARVPGVQWTVGFARFSDNKPKIVHLHE